MVPVLVAGWFVSVVYAKRKGEARRGTSPRNIDFAKRTRVSSEIGSLYEFKSVQQGVESRALMRGPVVTGVKVTLILRESQVPARADLGPFAFRCKQSLAKRAGLPTAWLPTAARWPRAIPALQT